jgi:hypothetical protein
MAYGWSGAANTPKEPERGSNVVTPVGASECTITVTRVDDIVYILTLSGGGRLTVQGTRDELRQFAVRLMLTFTAAEDEELFMRYDNNEDGS